MLHLLLGIRLMFHIGQRSARLAGVSVALVTNVCVAVPLCLSFDLIPT